jgi:hypothetical protein
MLRRIIRSALVAMLSFPLLARADSTTTPSDAGSSLSNEARLQQRIGELEKRLADVTRQRDELQKQLNQPLLRQFRLVIPPSNRAPGTSLTPALPQVSPDWQRSGAGNTWHYLIPTEQQ